MPIESHRSESQWVMVSCCQHGVYLGLSTERGRGPDVAYQILNFVKIFREQFLFILKHSQTKVCSP